MEPSLTSPAVWAKAYADAFADPVMIAFMVVVGILVVVGAVGNVVLTHRQHRLD